MPRVGKRKAKREKENKGRKTTKQIKNQYIFSPLTVFQTPTSIKAAIPMVTIAPEGYKIIDQELLKNIKESQYSKVRDAVESNIRCCNRRHFSSFTAAKGIDDSRLDLDKVSSQTFFRSERGKPESTFEVLEFDCQSLGERTFIRTPPDGFYQKAKSQRVKEIQKRQTGVDTETKTLGMDKAIFKNIDSKDEDSMKNVNTKSARIDRCLKNQCFDTRRVTSSMAQREWQYLSIAKQQIPIAFIAFGDSSTTNRLIPVFDGKELLESTHGVDTDQRTHLIPKMSPFILKNGFEGRTHKNENSKKKQRPVTGKGQPFRRTLLREKDPRKIQAKLSSFHVDDSDDFV